MKALSPSLLLTSLISATIAAVISALVVLAIDDGNSVAPLLDPDSPTLSDGGSADGSTPDSAVAATSDELTDGENNDPTSTAAAETSIDFDPARIFAEVSPAVVTVAVSFGGGFAGPDGGGSGFFVDTAGHLITNYHVVQNATTVTVILADGSRLDAQVLGFDQANDLAVLQVDLTGLEITPVTLGNSDLVQIGDPVATIGSPFGLQSSLSTGIVSGIERTRDGIRAGARPQRTLIQTDAAINPGNSGGVLINAQAEVIGVTASIESPVRGFVGVGFSIDSNTVLRFLPRMIAGEQIRHPWIGISGEPGDLSPGLRVADVVPDAPAAAAGLQAGDRLLSVDGVRLTDFEQLALYLDGKAVGDLVSFEIERGSETLRVELELAAWPG